ncbi:MAG: hypothetical protein EXS10_01785 [Phycisphaerales bacterium]|nr:hypothetical protein [Phycisphaerales bacterium]
MGPANVTSIEALERFRHAIVRFREQCMIALSSAESEIRGTFVWLERERIPHLKRVIPKLAEELNSAKGAKFRKELQTMGGTARPSIIDEKKAIQKAIRVLEDAQQRLNAAKRWHVALEREFAIYKGAVGSAAGMIDRDMPNAILRLRNMVLALEAYVATPTPTLAQQLEQANDSIRSMRRSGETAPETEETTSTEGGAA